MSKNRPSKLVIPSFNVFTPQMTHDLTIYSACFEGFSFVVGFFASTQTKGKLDLTAGSIQGKWH